MPERKHESDCDWLLAFLHQLASQVIDRRDMVRIYGMPQPEAISEEGCAEQHRVTKKQEWPTAMSLC